MPYKFNDPWHRAIRRFLANASIGPESHYQYTVWLNRAGVLLDHPIPSALTLADLRELESMLTCGETSKACMLTTVRAFLIFAGCKAARTWKFPYRARTTVNGTFLSEIDVAAIRQYAKALGPDTELIYSLGVDNGLRSIDMRRLTVQNALELLRCKHSTIIGKGRGGGKPGHLELSRMTERPLAQYLAIRQEWARTTVRDSDRLLVLPTSEGLRPVSEDLISNRITQLSTSSGIHFRTHDLRRTYGHRLHLAGVPIETIARLMRHESINQSFKAYIGILGDELRAAQDRLNGP